MRKRFPWLRAKTKTKLKPELQIKVVGNTCEAELGGTKPVNENCHNATFENFHSNSLLKIYVIHLEKSNIES